MTSVIVYSTADLIAAINTLNGTTGPHTITMQGSDADYIAEAASDTFFGGVAFPVIVQDITIYGGTIAITRALDAETKFRFFGIDAKSTGTNGKLTLQNLKLFNGDSDDAGGGAIVNDGELILYNCHLSGNVAGTYGGAIYAGDNKPVLIEACSFTNNLAAGSIARGGAIYGSTGSDLTITNSTFFGNRVQGGGSRGSAIANAYGVTGEVNDTDIFCNSVLDSNFDDAVSVISSFDAQFNWWGDATGPNGNGFTGSGQVIGGNVDASNYNSVPSSHPLTVWYDRSAAASYAIGLSRNNFDYGNSPFPYGSGTFTAPNSVGGDFTYNFLTHIFGATGSAVFMSEAIHRGGLPMTLGNDGLAECNQDYDENYVTGWRVCCEENGGATASWRVHPNILRYYLGIDLINNDSPSAADTLPYNDLFTYMKFDPASDGGGTWRSSQDQIDGQAYLYSLFDTGDLGHLDTGDYVYLNLGTNDRHGFLIVGWGEALSSPLAINAQENVEFHIERKHDGAEVPYIADFCYGYNGDLNYTGWLQDPRPRPFYTSAAEINDTQLTTRFGFVNASELADYNAQFQGTAWRRFIAAGSAVCGTDPTCLPSWRFFHLPNTVDALADVLYCPSC